MRAEGLEAPAPAAAAPAAMAAAPAPAVPAAMGDDATADAVARRTPIPVLRPPLDRCLPTGVEVNDCCTVAVPFSKCQINIVHKLLSGI